MLYQINKVLGKNENCVFYFMEKNQTDFSANSITCPMEKIRRVMWKGVLEYQSSEGHSGEVTFKVRPEWQGREHRKIWGSDLSRSRTARAKVLPGEWREKVRVAGVERKTQEDDHGGLKRGDGGLRREMTAGKERGHVWNPDTSWEWCARGCWRGGQLPDTHKR